MSPKNKDHSLRLCAAEYMFDLNDLVLEHVLSLTFSYLVDLFKLSREQCIFSHVK